LVLFFVKKNSNKLIIQIKSIYEDRHEISFLYEKKKKFRFILVSHKITISYFTR